MSVVSWQDVFKMRHNYSMGLIINSLLQILFISVLFLCLILNTSSNSRLSTSATVMCEFMVYCFVARNYFLDLFFRISVALSVAGFLFDSFLALPNADRDQLLLFFSVSDESIFVVLLLL